jgi:hypothetical protein
MKDVASKQFWKALENAVSVASVLLLAEAILPGEKKAAAAHESFE